MCACVCEREREKERESVWYRSDEEAAQDVEVEERPEFEERVDPHLLQEI